jgi:hypothetical protein
MAQLAAINLWVSGGSLTFDYAGYIIVARETDGKCEAR